MYDIPARRFHLLLPACKYIHHTQAHTYDGGIDGWCWGGEVVRGLAIHQCWMVFSKQITQSSTNIPKWTSQSQQTTTTRDVKWGTERDGKRDLLNRYGTNKVDVGCCWMGKRKAAHKKAQRIATRKRKAKSRWREPEEGGGEGGMELARDEIQIWSFFSVNKCHTRRSSSLSVYYFYHAS